jgi:hypothetical protein
MRFIYYIYIPRPTWVNRALCSRSGSSIARTLPLDHPPWIASGTS